MKTLNSSLRFWLMLFILLVLLASLTGLGLLRVNNLGGGPWHSAALARQEALRLAHRLTLLGSAAVLALAATWAGSHLFVVQQGKKQPVLSFTQRLTSGVPDSTVIAWVRRGKLGQKPLPSGQVTGGQKKQERESGHQFRQMDLELRQSNQILVMHSQCNRAIARATEIPGLLDEICQIMVDIGGYRSAWIGLAEQNETHPEFPAEQAGTGESCLETVDVTWADTEYGPKSSGIVAWADRPDNGSSHTLWRNQAKEHGNGSLIGLPLVANLHQFASLNILAEETNAFAPAQVNLLTELANDLVDGLVALRSRSDREAVGGNHAGGKPSLSRDVGRQHTDPGLLQRNRALELVNRVIVAAASELEPVSILEAACSELAQAIGAPQAMAALLNESRTTATIVTEYLSEERSSGLHGTIPITANPALQHMLTYKAPLAITDAQHDPRLTPIHNLMVDRGTVSVLILPLVIEGNVVGLLGLEEVESHEFAAEEISQAWSLTDQVTGALSRAWLDPERKHLGEQYHQAQKLESLGRMTAGIAHDFNNMLTAINGFTELMRLRMATDDPLQGYVEKVLDSGRRAGDLASQLLAFAGKQVLEPQVLDLNRTVAETEVMLQRIIGEDIELKTCLTADLWSVKVDAARFEQVIVNLVVNARDAMPQGGKLTIETANVVLDGNYAASHLETEPGEHVLLAVSDNGAGMSEDVMGHIFEPFFTTKGQGKGTGLGLATVYGIVKQSGGNIWVYSEEGVGTTFKIYLPRVTETAQPLPAKEVGEIMPFGTETILLVEDEPRVCEMAQLALERQGYTVLGAENGRQAAALVEGYPGPIHLLLTDVIMPGVSGADLAGKMAEMYPGMKTLFISGYTNEAIAHHGLLEPGVAMLQKPFSPMSLARKVRSVLDS